MYSLSLYPTITKPSRITSHSATLIDNIFTNLLDNKTISGLLVNDISDHLPVFLVYDSCFTRNKQDAGQLFKRIRTEETINSLKEELLNQNWELVLNEDNIDKAYETFLYTFKLTYDRNCPIRKVIKSNKYLDTPWITKGLKNACKKLYREFLKNRTEQAENKYKIYKNKLTTILRISKQEYYSKLLDRNKSNIKSIWNILNVIRKH